MGTQISIAAAVLVRNGLVLMVHRHPMRQACPDRWGLPGGHVEPSELPHEAVSRECLEEIGVHVHDPRPIPMVVADTDVDMTAFLVTRWTGEPVNAAPEEHDDLRWFSPGELALLKLAHPETLPNMLSAMQIATQ
ncbi:NUDIX domain-containing protein [Leekyejoonella antrihumi]|uniref:NUDIX domain-containing protein n=1 Tax=Leekyejoonella antrihumi TaxID=1660198 RepID=A0A563E4T3_9MICO|nr:NUDIX domain-containing protein [Leekyejoonella antrihumi]TWP37242.1 NUDIX domain-containing protein [Leekyejoonella antrihumi]